MVESIARLYLLVGPLLIISTGIFITVIYASKWGGLKSTITLFIGPLLTLIVTLTVTYFFTNVIKPSEGSGFLLGRVIMMLYFLGLLLYYPILLIFLLIKYIQSKKATTLSK